MKVYETVVFVPGCFVWDINRPQQKKMIYTFRGLPHDEAIIDAENGRLWMPHSHSQTFEPPMRP